MLSVNAFRTVVEIDLVSTLALSKCMMGPTQADMCFVQLGTYNTIKATLPHIRKTKGAYGQSDCSDSASSLMRGRY